ncbi:hypothetical protein BBJ29_003866 [Phytophthora kernoviae]|uniref:Rab-GAP TBC domain-containing protein n=1 Tax=Phytophthora kernoviae TaxID=325452 RepID=A0A3F2RPQ6_9STRA|nr:hypothetical protein BBP00_00005164 [Phytophthora kernoviae]RLN66621.1 hypothetical protein BBJ29_003866 [Phytophthora kernoviae]
MRLAPLFASVPRANSAVTMEPNLTMSPDDRLKHLQRILSPQIDRPTFAASISTRRSVENGRATECIATLDLEELRGLVFKGIPEINSEHLRPLAWRVLLGVVKGGPHEWPDQLRDRRADYHRWKQDFVGGTSSCRGGGNVRTEDENRRDIFLMKDIEKDVSRTRSELEFFSGGSIAQQQMLYILFVFAKLHPEVGYIQGMNEILAPIVYVCSTDPSAVQAFEVEADTFHIFASIMASLKVLYGRTPNEPLKSGANLQLSRFAQLLRQHDAALWQHLV